METDFSQLTNARKKLWSLKTWQEGRDSSFYLSNNLMSTGVNDSNAFIHFVDEMTATERGDECIMQLIADIEHDGVIGDDMLDGNEVSLVNDDVVIKIDQIRAAVRSRGKMAEQRTVNRFRAQARNKLGFWLPEKIDELMHLTAGGRAYTLNTDGSTRTSSALSKLAFAAQVAAASTNRVLYAGAATSEATLTASDTMSWNLIVETCAFAKRKRIKPLRKKGRGYYSIVMSTEQARDLKQDEDYQHNVSRAGVRGSANQLFSGAFAEIDGVMLFEHNKVFNTLGLSSGSKWGAGSDVDGAQAQLLGAQALGFAKIRDPSWTESDTTDHGNRPSIGYGAIIGMVKPQFIARADAGAVEDFGTVALKTAAAAT